MTTPFFVAYLEHSLDMGTITVVPAVTGADLTGSVATLRIGKVGQAALMTWRSDDPPDEGVFLWDDSELTLTIDLPASVINTLSVGRYWYRVTISTAGGVALPPPLQGHIRVADVVRT